MNGLEALNEMYNLLAIHNIANDECYLTIEKELKVLRILKKRKIDIFGLDLEMKLHPDWTLEQIVEYNNDGLPTPYHVTKEEMKLVIEWMQKKESEEEKKNGK